MVVILELVCKLVYMYKPVWGTSQPTYRGSLQLSPHIELDANYHETPNVTEKSKHQESQRLILNLVLLILFHFQDFQNPKLVICVFGNLVF